MQDTHRPTTVTRRAVLGGVVGAAALALVPELLRTPSAAAAPMRGVPGPVGSTIFGGVYPGTTRIEASAEFDGFVQRTACFSVQRVYFGVGEWPTDAANQSEVLALATHGIKMVVSFKPDGMQTSEYANLQASLAFLQQVRQTYVVDIDVILWHEANHDTQRFPQASDYRDLVAFYAPAVQTAGFPLVYTPIMSTGNAVAYDPGPALCDRIMVDFYADMYFVKGARLDTIMAHADQSGRPFGIAEWGLTASAQFQPTHAQFRTFAEYIQGAMVARLQAGRTNAEVIWFDDGGSDDISSSTDWKVPIFQSLYDALNP